METGASADAGRGDVRVVVAAVCEECARIAETKGMRVPPGEIGLFRRRFGDVLFEMEPGRDGVPWYLCAPHWFDGLHPNDPSTLGTMRVLIDPPVVQEVAPAPAPPDKPKSKRQAPAKGAIKPAS
jgi:hypothetical protein